MVSKHCARYVPRLERCLKSLKQSCKDWKWANMGKTNRLNLKANRPATSVSRDACFLARGTRMPIGRLG